MGVRKLDRNRYAAIVYGDPIKKYLQDGIFFTGNGVAIDGSEVAPATASIVPANEPVDVVELKDDSTAKLKGLMSLKIGELRKLAKKVHEATDVKLPAMSGKGVVARLTKYIADNTTD